MELACPFHKFCSPVHKAFLSDTLTSLRFIDGLLVLSSQSPDWAAALSKSQDAATVFLIGSRHYSGAEMQKEGDYPGRIGFSWIWCDQQRHTLSCEWPLPTVNYHLLVFTFSSCSLQLHRPTYTTN